jgi:GLPGLI family protein
MKKLILIVVSVLILKGGIFSQDRDNVIIRVVYETLSRKYSDSKGRASDLHYLDIGNYFSRYYSIDAQLLHEFKKEMISRKSSPQEILAKSKGYKTGSQDLIIKHYLDRKLLCYSKVIIQDYIYEEPMDGISWDFLEGNDTILGYDCKKAKAQFRGREWTAWYATEIPSPDGPWKLSGLPGLILKAVDSTGDFSFESTSIESPKEGLPMDISYHLAEGEAIKTDGKTLYLVKKKSIEDISGSIAAQGLTIVSVTDEKGVSGDIPKRKMNSIEEYK